ncbi:molecular chaperone HscC [Luteibacter rhizovicinus]|uniref:Molecular chaperone HscC n=1 Tax=Luteibacter rhizovicinus TaxID=242606 RepID=A0A4R3YLU0_9GAMM|nr:molecular chaperone HscC [Luteibacter rhizovicinus]TCV93201.1 molecular chaperone HscC [Luteibacter rhizovicinus]
MLVGIDLGTTHSLVSVWTDDGPRLIPNAQGKFLTPSVVGVDDAGIVLVGAQAQGRLVSHPQSTVAAFKRYMGTDRVTQLGDHRFRSEELSALVLKSLLADVRAELGVDATEAVISVPAYFSDAQRKATRNAGALAGIRVDRLVNEPTAAALAYGLEQRGNESRFLVLDLGGGTFDVSILEIFDGVMEVHATAGDNYLGGEDFVDVLMHEFCANHALDAGTLDDADRARLRDGMERIKRRLSQGPVTDASVELARATYSFSIDESTFEQRAGSLMARMRAPIERALRDAKLSSGDLDDILLVGGASRMPMVSRLITRMFGRLPLRHIHPDEAIARGTAVMAGLLSRAEALSEVVMTDVCPYTLGIEITRRGEGGHHQDGMFAPVIERNTVVPTSRVETFHPVTDYQATLKLRVFQGEAPRVVNNVLLGEIEVPLPRARAQDTPVDVRFTYDVSGIIQVEALVQSTQERHQLVILHNPGILDDAEVARRLVLLSHLKIHPREDQVNVTLIERAERLYEERTGEVRRMLTEWLQGFRGVLETQDPLRIRSAQKRMDELLSSVEADSPV